MWMWKVDRKYAHFGVFDYILKKDLPTLNISVNNTVISSDTM